MKGYKAYNKGLKCRDFQFEENKEYSIDGSPEICKKGFHFCENPLDTLNYYDLVDSEFTEVEAIGETQKESNNPDTKVVTNKIIIGAKLDLKGFIKASIDFIWQQCKSENDEVGNGNDSSKLASSGDFSKLASSRHCSQLASSGDFSKLASSGDFSQLASSGDFSKLASSGDFSKLASSRDSSQLAMDGLFSVGACIGEASKIKGGIGCWITLAEWDYNNELEKWVPKCVKSAQIDGEILKPDTWYKLKNSEFVECEKEEQS